MAVQAYGSDLQLALVARGLGFGIAPAHALARSPSRAELRTFRLKGHDLNLTIWTVRGRAPDAFGPVLDALDTTLADAFPIETLPAAARHRRRPER